nr:DNA-directed RNA polymerase subunit alpha C-terminal domain-containing protein [Rhizohabitans arisaemae]
MVSPSDRCLVSDLACPIEELYLAVGPYNRLKRAGIHTYGELVARSEQDLLEIERFGPVSVEDVKQRLAAVGLSLRDAYGDDPAE